MLLKSPEDVENWARSSKKRAYYYSPEVSALKIERILEAVHGEQAYGMAGRMDKPATYMIGHGSKARVLSPSEKWIPHTKGALPKVVTASEAEAQLEEIYEHALALGLAGKEGLSSPGSISKKILIKTTSYLKEGELGPMRALAFRGIHQGPMVAASGGAVNAHLYDRSAAFLHGLRVQVPVGLVPLVFRRDDGIVVDFNGREDPIEHFAIATRALMGSGPGFIEAEVEVLSKHFPTLPFESPIGPVYCTGVGRGVWSMRHLRAEMSSGRVFIKKVYGVYGARRAVSIYERAADQIQKIVEAFKPLGKALYLTAWGALCANGHGIELRPSRPSDEWMAETGARADKIWAHHWWCIRRPLPNPWLPQGVLCRPEHAVEVAGSNAAEVALAVLANERHGVTVHGAMTDSIWIDCPMERPGWKLEAGGDGYNLRQFAAGNNYLLDPSGDVVRYRAMGCQNVASPQAAEAAWRRCRADCSREWSGNPADWETGERAMSIPREMKPVTIDED